MFIACLDDIFYFMPTMIKRVGANSSCIVDHLPFPQTTAVFNGTNQEMMSKCKINHAYLYIPLNHAQYTIDQYNQSRTVRMECTNGTANAYKGLHFKNGEIIIERYPSYIEEDTPGPAIVSSSLFTTYSIGYPKYNGFAITDDNDSAVYMDYIVKRRLQGKIGIKEAHSKLLKAASNTNAYKENRIVVIRDFSKSSFRESFEELEDTVTTLLNNCDDEVSNVNRELLDVCIKPLLPAYLGTSKPF